MDSIYILITSTRRAATYSAPSVPTSSQKHFDLSPLPVVASAVIQLSQFKVTLHVIVSYLSGHIRIRLMQKRALTAVCALLI